MQSHTTEIPQETEHTSEATYHAGHEPNLVGTARELALIAGEHRTVASDVIRMHRQSHGGLMRIADVAGTLWCRPVVRAAVRAGTSALVLSLAARGARALLRERLPVLSRTRPAGIVTYAVVREMYVVRRSDIAR